MTPPPSIYHDLSSAIECGNLDDRAFNSLATRVFSYQFQNNHPYRKYCESLGKSPDQITQWYDIPAVPTDVFKPPQLPITTFPQEKTTHTFLTSGTTHEVKGQHHFPSLELYEDSIIGAWRELDLPRPRKAIFLTPKPDSAPQSSLSHMMGVLSHTFAESSTWLIDSNGTLNINTFLDATSGEEPVAILGTALSFLHLFQQLDTPITLPTGSWAMETGGYKGTQKSIPKESLYSLFSDKLDIAPDSIINEYSMTELSSQFYTRGLGGLHTGPSWTRTRVIDPLSQTDALPGKPGHLVIYDLANLHSVMAIQTQDIAIAGLAEKHHSFTLLGRDPSALPRGCSRIAGDTP